MLKKLTSAARNVIVLAEDEARKLNHDFIGTEHILLGLVAQESDIVLDVLKTMGVDADKVRCEVERLIQRGTKPVSPRVIPWTPRAKKAIQFAIDGASNFDQSLAGTEHLLLGLVRETEGVACQVLLNLGVKPHELQAGVLKIRLAQMKIIERAVRPVRASTTRKRKMREELLAHLTTIYDQELERVHDPNAALEAAAQRFGNPIELARELEAALPPHERASHFVEHFMRYRAPESAARFSLRMAINTSALLAVIGCVATVCVFVGQGWGENVKALLSVMGGIVLLTLPATFAVWLSYIKMRDALWGAFGSRQSLARALMLDILIAAVATLYLMGVAAVSRLDFGVALEAARLCGWMPIVSAIALACLAYTSGPTEIRDTIWALLNIEDPRAQAKLGLPTAVPPPSQLSVPADSIDSSDVTA